MSSVKQLAAWDSSSSAKFSPGHSTACSTWSTASFAVLRTLDEDKQWQLLAGVVWSLLLSHEARCNLAAQLAGNHARRAETRLTRSAPLWRREWGRLVTTTFTGPLRACSPFTSALSVAAPIGSERIGRNQYVAYRRRSDSGVARDSARRVSEQMYCASFSASRSVKLRAACVNTSSTVSIASLSHNSAAIDEEAGKLVLYGRQRDGKFNLQPQVWESTQVVRLEEDVGLRLRTIHHGCQLWKFDTLW